MTSSDVELDGVEHDSVDRLDDVDVDRRPSPVERRGVEIGLELDVVAARDGVRGRRYGSSVGASAVTAPRWYLARPSGSGGPFNRARRSGWSEPGLDAAGSVLGPCPATSHCRAALRRRRHRQRAGRRHRPRRDDFLAEHGLVKGSMTLVETERALDLYQALGAAVEMSGGSAANTMCGVASFGGRAAYIGKVSRRRPRAGVRARPARRRRAVPAAVALDRTCPTGRCIIVVTPDAQRTMNTYLGVSSLLGPPTTSTRRPSPTGRCCTWRATCSTATRPRRRSAGPPTVAHAHGRKVSLTLSDSFCVDRHRDDFPPLVADEVDILFGNEDELMALYEVDSISTTPSPRCATDCALVVVTDRRRGLARRHAATRSCRCRPSPWRGCSTPPAPATCTPPGSCSATPAVARWPSAAARLDRRRRGDQPRRPPPPRRAAYGSSRLSRDRPRERMTTLGA